MSPLQTGLHNLVDSELAKCSRFCLSHSCTLHSSTSAVSERSCIFSKTIQRMHAVSAVNLKNMNKHTPQRSFSAFAVIVLSNIQQTSYRFHRNKKHTNCIDD